MIQTVYISMFSWDWSSRIGYRSFDVREEIFRDQVLVHDLCRSCLKQMEPLADRDYHTIVTLGRPVTVEEAKEYYDEHGVDTESWDL